MLACFDLAKVLSSPQQRTAKDQNRVSIESRSSNSSTWLPPLVIAPTTCHLSASSISSGSNTTSSHASRPSDEMLTTNSAPLNLDSQSIASPALDLDPSRPSAPADDDDDGRGLEVEDLLWEAQMGFVNHKLELAIDRFTTAARLGSSEACLNLASLYLTELGHQPSPGSSSDPASAVTASTPSFFSPTQQSLAPQLRNRLYTGACWAITGLRYQLDRKRSARSPSLPSQTRANPASCSAIDLNLAFDLVSLLLSLYCHGKIKQPSEPSSGPTSQPCLWNDGAAIALRLLNHPLFYPTFTATNPSASALISDSSSLLPPSIRRAASPRPNRSQTVSTATTTFSYSNSRSLSQDIKTTRTIVVQCAYLLALTRWPFSQPPSDLSSSVPNLSLSPSHWGQTQARQLWFVIIGISELPGGTGTRAGEAIVEKAYQRLNALERPRSPSTIHSTPPRETYRHRRYLSMLPAIPAPRPGPVASPVLSAQPAQLHRSTTFPNLCLSQLASVLGRPQSIRSVQTQPRHVGMAPFFLGYRQGRTLSSTIAPPIPTITIETFHTSASHLHTPPPGSNSSTGVSVEERLQQALVADEEARLTGYFDWGVQEEDEEEEEEEEEGGEGEEGQWETQEPDRERLVVPVGMDPVLKALEAESRLNVEADCAVCGLSCTNSPTCPKCGLVFCSRACRTIACTSGRHAKCSGDRRMASASDLTSLTSSAAGE